MKIAFISQPWNSVDPPMVSTSTAIWTYQVATRLARRCSVVVYAKSTARRGSFEYEGVDYRYMPVGIETCLRPVIVRLLKFGRTPPFSRLSCYPEYIMKIARDAAREQYDIIHIHNFSQFAPFLRRYSPKSKLVLHMQCEWLTQLDSKVIAKRLESVNMTLGCSRYITDTIRKAFPRYAGRCETLYNGVDVDHFNNPQTASAEEPLILYVGRIMPEKGLHVLLEAFKKVRQVVPGTRLNIVGDEVKAPREFAIDLSYDPLVKPMAPSCAGNYSGYLKKLLDDDAARSVNFLGNLPHHRLPELYKEATVLAHPALSDPFGMPLIEAMAAGTPVVATDAGGMSEIVENGNTGLLIRRNDPDALAAAILKLITDRALRSCIGKAARNRAVDFFSWEAITDKLLWYYQNMKS